MSVSKQLYTPFSAKARKSYWILIPWTGLVSLFFSFSCGFASLIVGLKSNEAIVDSWKISNHAVQPSVLLSILATLANTMLRVAFTNGVATTWWLRSHRGASLRELSTMHEHSQSIWSVVRIPQFSQVTLAACAMLSLLADGPFFQKASTTVHTEHTQVNNITVEVSDSPLVLGSTGVITGHDQSVPSSYTPEFAQIMQQYSSRQSISLPGLNYTGTIAMDLVAPGWDIQCANGTYSYRLVSYDEMEGADAANGYTTSPPRTQTMFESNVTYLNPEDDGIPAYRVQFSTSYKGTPGGNGTMFWQNCTLTEAVVRYPLSIVGGLVELQAMPLTTNRTEYLVERAYEESSLGIYPSTLGGFSIALNYAFAAAVSLYTVTVKPPLVEKTEDAVASQYVDPSVTPVQMGTYDIFWTNPTDNFLAMANELALRVAIGLTDQSTESFTTEGIDPCYQPTCAQTTIIVPDLAKVNRTVSQSVTATMSLPVLEYHTALGWLLAGFGTIVLSCALVAPLYWGWWELGRTYTMNPLDTAKAFEAPLLEEADPFVPPTAWAIPVLEGRVRYGIDVASDELAEEALGGRVRDYGEELNENEDGHESVHKGPADAVRMMSQQLPKFRKVKSI